MHMERQASLISHLKDSLTSCNARPALLLHEATKTPCQLCRPRCDMPAPHVCNVLAAAWSCLV